MSDPERHRQALAQLPHGPEFRFLDAVFELEPGRRASAEYRVRGDEPFLAGHFPGDPLWPGVLLIESLAQLAGILVQTDPERGPMPRLKLTALRNVKILDSARPGDVLKFQAEIIGRLGKLAEARGSASIRGREILQAQLTLAGGD